MEYPILAIDFGRKHIGIAISDSKGIVASPYEVIHVTKNSTTESILQQIQNIANENRVKSLLFGIPQSFEESHNINRTRIQSFIDLVTGYIKLPYDTIDESYSTSFAKDIIIDSGLRFKKRKKDIDSIAASVFLQEYLNSKK